MKYYNHIDQLVNPITLKYPTVIHSFCCGKVQELNARTGPWLGNRFSGNPVSKSSTVYYNKFFLEQKEIYYVFHLFIQSSTTPTTKLKLTSDGNLQRLIWNDQNQEWVTYLTSLVTDCDQYKFCGPYGTCDINSSPGCSCLRGFDPKILEKWEAIDWKGERVRITPLECGHDGVFIKY